MTNRTHIWDFQSLMRAPEIGNLMVDEQIAKIFDKTDFLSDSERSENMHILNNY